MEAEDVKPEIDFEKFKKVTEKLALADMLPIVISTINSLKEFAEFIIAIGVLQQKNQEAYEFIEQVGEQPQAFLAVLVDRIPPEKLKSLIENSLEMSSIQSKMSQFQKLSSVDKVALGEKLREIAQKLSASLEELKTLEEVKT